MIQLHAEQDVRIDAGVTRVTFDCPGAWPVLCPEAAGGIGGAEVRAVTFARELARTDDMDVHFLVRSDYCLPTDLREGITVHFEPKHQQWPTWREKYWGQACRLSDRLAGSVTKRLTGRPERRRFIEQMGYDVMCCFGVTNRTASLVRSSRQQNRPVIVFLTSDRSLDDLQLTGRRQRGVYGEVGSLCRYALQLADAVVVQKESQRALLERLLGIEAIVIRNPIDLSSRSVTTSKIHVPAEPYALWVGRADTFSKRADRCWQLARRCPKVTFVAVVNRHDPGMYQQLQNDKPPNVTLIPHVPVAEIECLYERATILINTSDAEGFPNSFLQAGKYGVPVVSLNVDPDGVLQSRGGGVCCHGCLATMERHVERLIVQDQEYFQMSKSIRKYTCELHGLPDRCRELEQLIRTTVNRPLQVELK